MMRLYWKWVLCVMSIWTWPFSGSAAVQQLPTHTPQQALAKLVEGNKRYVDDKLLHPNRSQESREASAEGQAPFAIILGCADSRVLLKSSLIKGSVIYSL